MNSRRGKLLFPCLAVVGAWATLDLSLRSTLSSHSFARPSRPCTQLAPSRQECSSKAAGCRLELLARGSFFSRSSSTSTASKPQTLERSVFNEDEIDVGELHDVPLGFGKHRLMTYSEVVRDYPHYCASILEMDELSYNQMAILDFQKYLKKINFEAPLSFSPTSRSKHAGKTFREVMEAEPLYCIWALKNDVPTLARFRNYLEVEGYKAPDMQGTLPFGRYKGKEFAKVLKEDPSYCMWVKSLDDDASGMLLDFRNYLIENFVEDDYALPDLHILPFGRHKGKEFSQVMTEDTSYCSWVMSLTSADTKNIVMLRFKEFLEDQGFEPSEEEENLLGVGKHKGMTFEEVMTKEPSYSAWVMSLSEGTGSSRNMMKFKAFLEQHGFQAPAPQVEQKSASSVLTVGKHKGKTLADVMEEDPSYCSWVMSLQSDGRGSKALLGFRSFLKEQGFHASLSKIGAINVPYTMPFGKFKGMTFEEVLQKDRTYCSWVMSLPTEGTSGALLNFQSFLVDKGVDA